MSESEYESSPSPEGRQTNNNLSPSPNSPTKPFYETTPQQQQNDSANQSQDFSYYSASGKKKKKKKKKKRRNSFLQKSIMHELMEPDGTLKPILEESPSMEEKEGSSGGNIQ